MIKVLSIIGTRPEAIKTSVLHQLLLNNNQFSLHLCMTGQHVAPVRDVLSFFGLQPDSVLQAADENDMSAKVSYLIDSLQNIISKVNPHVVLIQGDTLSSFCGALVAYLNRVPCAHIESGLRTHNNWSPFPEEVFRKFNDISAELLFAPTENAAANLEKECLDAGKVHVTGNTAIDALNKVVTFLDTQEYSPDENLVQLLNDIRNKGEKPGLITLHRRENWGDKGARILRKVDRIAGANKLALLYPQHPNVKLQDTWSSLSLGQIRFIPTQSYPDFIWLMRQVDLVFTDSGGIQEEGPHLGTPVIVLRDETERPEAIEEKHNHFMQEFDKLAILKMLQAKQKPTRTLYGDGKASERIMAILEERFL